MSCVKRVYPRQPIVGVGAVIVCKGKILLEKRKNEPGKGKWTIPGGLVELGESLHQAVIRETKEETSLDVEEPSFLDIIDYVERDEEGKIKYHFVIVDYSLRSKSNRFRAASDAEELRWVSLDKVEVLNLTQSFRIFFQRNRGGLENLNCVLEE